MDGFSTGDRPVFSLSKADKLARKDEMPELSVASTNSVRSPRTTELPQP